MAKHIKEADAGKSPENPKNENSQKRKTLNRTRIKIVVTAVGYF